MSKRDADILSPIRLTFDTAQTYFHRQYYINIIARS